MSCDGSRHVKVVGRSIDTRGSAIVVSGNCEVVIDRSHIRADGIAINVSGSGEVIIRASVIEGHAAALVISGAAKVRSERSRVIGRRSVTGSGDLIDGGGNDWK